jgi:hypothetical protein
MLAAVAGRRRAVLAGPSATYSLSGTSVSPNQVSDTQTSPTDSDVYWEFNTSGQVWKHDTTGTQLNDGVEFTDEQDSPTVDLWIRATLDGGDAPTSGPALTSWWQVTGGSGSTRRWTWTETGDGFFTTAGTIQVDIATDSGGSNIVATGYYRGTATVEL